MGDYQVSTTNVELKLKSSKLVNFTRFAGTELILKGSCQIRSGNGFTMYFCWCVFCNEKKVVQSICMVMLLINLLDWSCEQVVHSICSLYISHVCLVTHMLVTHVCLLHAPKSHMRDHSMCNEVCQCHAP